LIKYCCRSTLITQGLLGSCPFRIYFTVLSWSGTKRLQSWPRGFQPQPELAVDLGIILSCWFVRHSECKKLWKHGGFHPDFKGKHRRLGYVYAAQVQELAEASERARVKL
jgi:hypothetical protein